MKELYKCPYDTAIKCCMEESCKGCEDFTPNHFTYQYSEEFMFEFSKWSAKNYMRLTETWIKIQDYGEESPIQIFTTKELLEEFKKGRDEYK